MNREGSFKQTYTSEHSFKQTYTSEHSTRKPNDFPPVLGSPFLELIICFNVIIKVYL